MAGPNFAERLQISRRSLYYKPLAGGEFEDGVVVLVKESSVGAMAFPISLKPKVVENYHAAAHQAIKNRLQASNLGISMIEVQMHKCDGLWSVSQKSIR